MKNRHRTLIALSLLGIFISAFVITDIAGASPRFGFIQKVGELLGVSSIPTSAVLRNETTEKVSQASSLDDSSGDFWQEVPKTQNDNLGRAIEIQASEYRAFTLNKDAMRTKLSGAPQEFTADARRGTFVLSLPAPDYLLTVTSKRYRFATRTVTLTENLADVNLVGLE